MRWAVDVMERCWKILDGSSIWSVHVPKLSDLGTAWRHSQLIFLTDVIQLPHSYPLTGPCAVSFMWQTNGAGLRGFSFALRRCGRILNGSLAPFQRARHAFWRCHASPPRFWHTQAGLVHDEGAISENEFLEALNSVLSPLNRNEKSKAVGIAVSGGVDSMALATLYARSRSAGLPPLHGFIIDHKARPESTVEAQWVAQELSARQ